MIQFEQKTPTVICCRFVQIMLCNVNAILIPLSCLHVRLCVCVCSCAAYAGGVLEEIIHNLDYCDILVLGEELRPEAESLQLDRSSLLGMHLDATNSTSGMSIYGRLVATPLPPRY